VLLVAQQQVPVVHYLGREDLLPWMTLTLSVVALLRGRSLGPGPHPMLTPRVDGTSWYLRKVAMALSPWALLLAYDGARALDLGLLAASAGVTVGVLVC